MGWIEKIESRPAHTCGWPGGAYLDAERIAAGSIWECDVCGTRWRFDGWRYGQGSAQNDRDAIWTKIATPFKPFDGLAARAAFERDDPSRRPDGGYVQQMRDR